MFKEGSLRLLPGIDKIMPLEIQPKELLKNPEVNNRAIIAFGWDIDGFSIDSMTQIEELCVESVVEHFTTSPFNFSLSHTQARNELINYELSHEKALKLYEENPNLAGKKYIEKVGSKFGCSPEEEHIKQLVADVRSKISAVVAKAMPLAKEAMWRLQEDNIYQFVLSNATHEGCINKLDYADMLEYFDPLLIGGSNYGGLDRRLSKVEQLDKIGEVFVKREIVRDVDEFIGKTAYGTDMAKDVIELEGSGLRLVIGLVDKATNYRKMSNSARNYLLGTFIMRNAMELIHIPIIINRINAIEESKTPVPRRATRP